MTVSELITLIIVFFIAGMLLLFSIRSFLERGFLLNNEYLFASKEERKTMNKKPYIYGHRNLERIVSFLPSDGKTYDSAACVTINRK